MNNCSTIDDIRRIYKRKLLDKFFQPYFPLLCALYSKQICTVDNDEKHHHKDDADFVVKIVNTAGYDMNTPFVHFICGMYYDDMKHVDLMKKYYLMAIEQGSDFAIFNMGSYHNAKKEYELMKKYYLMAIEHGHSIAMYNLGVHYHQVEKDYELMKKYYLMAIEHANSDAMFNLGVHYEKVEREYELMKKYYLMAIEHGDDFPLRQLMNYFKDKELMLYKVLIEVEEVHRTAKLKQTLLGLEQNYFVNMFNNKVRLFKRLQNYKQCAICLEENVLNITLECSHEVCVACYDLTKKCFLRYEEKTTNKRRRFE